ncbi:hypothetical protein BT96DRAFT_317884 [Gymnopus androsaceus JB14]|uniref:Uncharacterized protein n=1 Tax=Gymnopus androsaceus JB14 TaxID=1447944 RepID=A0A6A4H1J9_9AGAR|nr:hypothetical protein BT96DRAFT_317884 [Gymnopus androsaceus JB14]
MKQGNSKTLAPTSSRHKEVPTPVPSPPTTRPSSPDRDRDRDQGRGRSPNPRKRSHSHVHRDSRSKSRSPSYHSHPPTFSRADFSRAGYPPGYPYNLNDMSRFPNDIFAITSPPPHLDLSAMSMGRGDESMGARMMYQQMMLQQQHQQQVAQRRERLAALQAAQAAGHGRPPRQSPIDGSHRQHSQDHHYRGSTSASAPASEISDLVAFFDAVDRGGGTGSPSSLNALTSPNPNPNAGSNSDSWLDFLSNAAPASTIPLASSGSSHPHPRDSWGRSSSSSTVPLSVNIPGIRSGGSSNNAGGSSSADPYPFGIGMGMGQLSHLAHSQYPHGHSSMRNPSSGFDNMARQQMLADVFSGGGFR